jgi:hypothetical protein
MLGDHIRALKDGRWLHGIDLGDQRVLYLAEAPGREAGRSLGLQAIPAAFDGNWPVLHVRSRGRFTVSVSGFAPSKTA